MSLLAALSCDTIYIEMKILKLVLNKRKDTICVICLIFLKKKINRKTIIIQAVTRQQDGQTIPEFVISKIIVKVLK